MSAGVQNTLLGGPTVVLELLTSSLFLFLFFLLPFLLLSGGSGDSEHDRVIFIDDATKITRGQVDFMANTAAELAARSLEAGDTVFSR